MQHLLRESEERGRRIEEQLLPTAQCHKSADSNDIDDNGDYTVGAKRLDLEQGEKEGCP